MTLQSKLAYLAGFFDGEGSFSICRTRSTVRTMADGSTKKYIVYKLDVSLTNTNREVLDWIASNFGGAVYTSKQESRKSTYLPRYSWRCNNNEERERFILGVLPYLKVKKPMAEVALEFCKTYQAERIGTTLNPEVQSKRDDLRKKMMSLNGVYSGASTRPVETTRETPQAEGDDIVRTA